MYFNLCALTLTVILQYYVIYTYKCKILILISFPAECTHHLASELPR